MKGHRLLAFTSLVGCASTTAPCPRVDVQERAPVVVPVESPTRRGTDCHMHVHPHGEAFPYDAARATSALDGARLERGCVLSKGYQPPMGCEEEQCQARQHAFTTEQNDWMLAQAAAAPERLIPFCAVPLAVDWAAKEVERCAAAGGRGLKLHPVSQRLSLRDPATRKTFEDIAAVAQRAKIPILIHIKHHEPDEIDALFEIARAHPELKIIAAHMMAANMAKMLEAPDNVLMEVSGLVLAPPEAYPAFAQVWRQIGFDRIMLGSDWPLLHPSEHLAVLEAMPLSEEERLQIVETTAAELFGSAN